MPSVLIADPDPLNRRVLAAALSLPGISLIEAGDGAQAVDICTREQPNLSIVEIVMPDMDGLEAIGRIRAYSKEMPIIASYRGKTDGRDAEILSVARSLGASAVVTQPVEHQRLIALVLALIHGR